MSAVAAPDPRAPSQRLLSRLDEAHARSPAMPAGPRGDVSALKDGRACRSRRRDRVEHVAAWSRPRVSSTSSTAVSRTWRSTPSRTCWTSTRLAPVSPTSAEQLRERAGAVATRVSTTTAAGLRLVAAGDLGEQAGVDVAAREHDDGRARARRARPAPPSSAATPTAPAPSTTSLAFSISSTIASAIVVLGDRRRRRRASASQQRRASARRGA